MIHRITIHDLDDLDRAAREFLDEIGDSRIIALYAPMGAGKTTFTTALCRVLGVEEDAVSSPSFSIVNEYRTGSGEPMYHFDFYRIEKIAEALDIGFYDYIDSGCLCIMEWPENIETILPEEALRVHISVNPDESRTVSWES
ncbi:MAG: tRNA (adenosine(37)-N6)-threonylcarbamoyltransferase complex ATPase subunit type 1 TsaE [Bacteroidales bacterium]|nr:tRNA (adenosine(37)-N6)-threonylcarbamoyltransferase complex ATPase subunit type 1 TsaE [Bacteroidales bacterium]